MLAPTSRLSTLELSTFDRQLLAVWRLFFWLSPLQCAHAQERVRNSFGMCTYKSLDLKSPGMNTYKKYRGGGGLRSLQTQDLSLIFHCEGPIKASNSAQVPLPSTASAYPVPGLQATRPRLAQGTTEAEERDLSAEVGSVRFFGTAAFHRLFREGAGASSAALRPKRHLPELPVETFRLTKG